METGKISATGLGTMTERLASFEAEVKGFDKFGKRTQVYSGEVPIFVNEFWTSKQRGSHSLHEVTYRSCFKPELPNFFIDRLTEIGETVYDPFMGRGTTLVEAGLMGRKVIGCDVNPMSAVYVVPRFHLPDQDKFSTFLSHMRDAFEKKRHLKQIVENEDDFLPFYHRNTLNALSWLKDYIRMMEPHRDELDYWMQLVATTRLTGHSSGFFSVYTLPPNSPTVTPDRQRKLNEKNDLQPKEKDIWRLIRTKSDSLLRDVTREDTDNLISADLQMVIGSCDDTPEIESESVNLTVTSPPFLDLVDYKKDNWIRSWFNSLDVENMKSWRLSKVEDWTNAMSKALKEVYRVTAQGGILTFEVGEVRGGSILLEDKIIPVARDSGFIPKMVVVNDQKFTKVSNCWGVNNSKKGTNTNRIIVMQKEGT